MLKNSEIFLGEQKCILEKIVCLTNHKARFCDTVVEKVKAISGLTEW